MPKLHFTDLAIQKLKAPAEGTITYWDDATSAFGVRVSYRGRKTWIVMRGKSRTRSGLGHYPEVSLSVARTEAKRILANKPAYLLTHITLQDAYESFKQIHTARKKNRTKRDYERIINVHFLPALSGKRLDLITPHTLSAITDALHDRPSEQGHALAVARTFFRWCVRRRYLQSSPLEGVLVAKQQARDRALSDKELVAVYRAAREYGYPFGTILQLLCLTGQRRGEIAALRSEWIDFAQQTITLPAQITKNGRQHTFPFGDLTKSVLEECPSFDGVLFPARGGSGNAFSGWSKSKQTLDEKLENVAPWTLHDLRRTFATNLAALNVPPHIVEKLLNHASGTISGVAAIYNRFQYADEARNAMRQWEGRLAIMLAAA